MKKYTYHMVFLALLGLTTLYFYQVRRSTTIERRQMDFAVSRPAAVSEITITGNEGRIVLQRGEKGKWILNSRYEVRQRAIDIMLQTLARIRVISPVSLTAADDLMNRFREEAMQIDLRLGNRTRRYLIYSPGGQSPTYMMRHGGSQAFVVEVLGFNGHVASLFVSDEAYWRPNILFNYHLNEIAEVIVQHRDPGQESFMLNQSADRKINLYSYPEGNPIDGISDSLAVRFLANFFYVPYERFADHAERAKKDSLSGIGTDHLITVRDHRGTETSVHLYKIVTGNGEGDTTEYDPFRLYALIGDKTEMVIVPYHSVDLLLRSASWFIPPRQ
jgi:hypothetical protein